MTGRRIAANGDMDTQEGDTETLASMLYSSRATMPFDAPELASLASDSSERNRERRVTGGLFHENGRFLQYLEGPPDNIDSLFDTISRDTRHSDIEVLAVGSADTRAFADWNLRLFRNRQSIPDRLHLATPCTTCKGANCVTEDAALELARSDGAAFFEGLAAASGQFDVQTCFCERLEERFNALWAEDACGEADITIGQALALAAVRRTTASNSPELLPGCRDRILVTSAPGEHHHLRAALATTSLSAAGYPAVYLPSETIEELVETLYQSRYAGLVLVTGSRALTDGQRHTLYEICRLARFWSRPPLKVALYGRVPPREDGRIDLAGADHVCVSARHLPDFFDRDVRRIL